jgi:hypothetical protein
MSQSILEKVSIKGRSWDERDEFLSEAVNKSSEQGLLVLADTLLNEVPKARSKYDKANALTCAAIFLWFANRAADASEINNRALKALDGLAKERTRGRLTHLIHLALSTKQPAEHYKDVFTI